VLTFVFNATKLPAGADETLPAQYTIDPLDSEPVAVPAGVGAGVQRSNT
jgi:hypothetical protein